MPSIVDAMAKSSKEYLILRSALERMCQSLSNFKIPQYPKLTLCSCESNFDNQESEYKFVECVLKDMFVKEVIICEAVVKSSTKLAREAAGIQSTHDI